MGTLTSAERTGQGLDESIAPSCHPKGNVLVLLLCLALLCKKRIPIWAEGGGEMKRLCLKSVSEVSGSVWQILGLCWRADPFSMVMLLVIQSLQGIVPLAVAWLAKSLFDVLVHGIRADAGPQFLSTLFIL